MEGIPLVALETLGLDGTADERAIRKAYARLLKEQDLEESPEAFQRLRQAYERVLAWHRNPDPEMSFTGIGGEPSLQPLKAPPSAFPQELSPAERDGDAVFECLLADLEALSFYPGLLFIQQHLLLCWQDPRLVSIAARERFELRVVDLLVDEFCPFEKVLVPAAVGFFDWGRDRSRLARFGEAGRNLNYLIDRCRIHPAEPSQPVPLSVPRVRPGATSPPTISRIAWRVGISVHGCKEGVVLALALLFIDSLRTNLGHGPTGLPRWIHVAAHIGLAAGLTHVGAGIGRWFALRAARRHFRNWGLYALGAWPGLTLASVILDAGIHAGLSVFYREPAMGRWEAFLLNLDPAWGITGITMALASFAHLYLFKDHCAA